MNLVDTIRIVPRYQRAARIDADLGSPSALDGFICTPTFARALDTLTDQVARTGQGAFTWTGPYGGGKSSLVIALAALLGAPGKLRNAAISAVGTELGASVIRRLKPGSKGWQVIPVVGERRFAADIILGSLTAAGLYKGEPSKHIQDRENLVLTALEKGATSSRSAGLLLVFDELGKTFEYSAETAGDLYFFQRLAELASRSEGRLIFLGILHQAFDEYAGRLGREQRDEWAKVQGRFLDIPLQIAGPEQLEILSQAIINKDVPGAHSGTALTVVKALRKYRPETEQAVVKQLKRCWPLNPVAACLLGPISRRRFGQNQRSIFGFLNSSEPQGFQDFLRTASSTDNYGPDRLWDYLQTNLEPAILASSDGHRWSLAVDAVERCEGKGGGKTHAALVKAIALLDLFRERSGLFASEAVLAASLPDLSPKLVRSTLDDLVKRSIIVFREHLGAYAIYAGSDFDIEAAVEEERRRLGRIDLHKLRQLANLRPVVAKRHYHKTGALRWFDVHLLTTNELERAVREFHPNGSMGQFLLVLQNNKQTIESARNLCHTVSESSVAPIIIGLARSGAHVEELAQVLLALEHVRHHSPELGGDSVARREVDARLVATTSALEIEVRQAFEAAEWWLQGKNQNILGMAGLAHLASELADKEYSEGPSILNELLNRTDPSGNAVAARRALLRAMVSASTSLRLGIEGYPAEGGLYASILETTGLHRQKGDHFGFFDPTKTDPAHVAPLFAATDQFLHDNKSRVITAQEIYVLWGNAPYGVREGLKPVLLIAYILARGERFNVYRDGRFEPSLTELMVDTLLQDPRAFGLRTFDINSRRRRFLEAAREIAIEFDQRPVASKVVAQPIDIARGLIAFLQSQPKWTLRTNSLSRVALATRKALKDAEDPKVLLFEDLPKRYEEALNVTGLNPDRAAELLREGLTELRRAYSQMLKGLEERTRAELDVAISDNELGSLRERAERIKGLTGDFRLEAFITRLTAYGGIDSEFEGIASLAANKPPRDWSDNDVDRASMELADLAQRFNRAEAFARVKGRTDGRHAVAFVIGLDHGPNLVSREFDISESDRAKVLQLARELQSLLAERNMKEELVLGAIAQVGSTLLGHMDSVRRRRSGR